MKETRQQRFVRKWFSEWEPDPPVFGRASELMHELLWHDPERAWEAIIALVENAPNEDSLGYVGAGPLEDLLSEHGQRFIDRVENLARSSDRFRECLQSVYAPIRIDPEIYARLRRARGEDSA